jgi:excisionase family DNA binding protein
MSERHALTTGEIARACGVHLRTVVRWIERRHLKAYQLPGRGDNRVEIPDFLDFLRRHRMPVPEAFRAETRRVLVVEDDADVAAVMQRILAHAGYEARWAADGFAAGALLGTFLPAVVTMDLSMPGLSGIEVIRQIRANPRLAGVRVLVVSALPAKDMDEALAAGADDALSKPFEAQALLDKVARLTGTGAKTKGPAT